MIKQRRRPRTTAIPETPLERLEQGEGGERALQDWLDRSKLAYVFLDQRPLTIPASHRAHLKRPDFLVALGELGTVALDAKAKSFVGDYFTLDVAERRRLEGFENLFGTPVWYVCFPPGSRQECYLFRNRVLMGAQAIVDVGRQVVQVPRSLGFAVDYGMVPLDTALGRAWR